MKLLLVIDSHIFKTKDGKYWCKGITDAQFFDRYLKVFDTLKIATRVQQMDKVDEKKFLRVDNDKIEMIDIPFARNIKEYIKNYGKIKTEIKKEVLDCNCIIYRLPSIISYIGYLACKRQNKPYAVEIVADPEDAYKDYKIIGFVLKQMLKKITYRANGASYVTEKFLQSKYPSRARKKGETKEFFETYYSSIDLKESFFGTKKDYKNKKEYIVSHTANISKTMVKGQDILIKAVGLLCKKGYNLRIKFIGDSEIKDKYYEIARENGIIDKIVFTGLLPNKVDIRNELINSDIFVLPTKSEGLPRSIIEAMAVGLPCVSTPISGIPELLPAELLVKQNDYKKFAEIIESLIKNPEEMEKISERNIEKAKDYEYQILTSRRNEFYEKLKNVRD
ncbi:MAG: glycosyltransferase family 4 protein [Clostridia bacterium]|nr:glycosyltransferase family 4 protein [Clostridia bacterium]